MPAQARPIAATTVSAVAVLKAFFDIASLPDHVGTGCFGASAADLKFLHHSPRIHPGISNR
jgi:hypothetical protein